MEIFLKGTSMEKKKRIQIFLSEENYKIYLEHKTELERLLMEKVSESEAGNFMITCLRKKSIPVN